MAARFRVTVLTLFPELMRQYFATSILGKAVEAGAIEARVVNIRDYATDKHRSCDDAPYGGGAGMVLLPGPLAAALDDVGDGLVVFPTPSGRPFRQQDAADLAQREAITVICGRYEGIDQRIVDRYVDVEYSIGDYVLSSGEVAAMVIVEAAYRLIEGVIRQESHANDSFQDGLLEHPHYTRPEVFRGDQVPEVLLSGHHANITAWRRKKQLAKTLRNRPDLLQYGALSADDRSYIQRLQLGEESEDE